MLARYWSGDCWRNTFLCALPVPGAAVVQQGEEAPQLPLSQVPSHVRHTVNLHSGGHRRLGSLPHATLLQQRECSVG